MQKSIYRVRTLATLDGRIKLDLFRDMAHQQRRAEIAALHAGRQRIAPEEAAETAVRSAA